MMTKEQTRRTIEALAETRRLIAKEMAYSPKFRKQDYLKSLRLHAAKLRAMLRGVPTQ